MTEQRKGELILLSQTLISGFFPIVTVLTYAQLAGLISLAWSLFFGMLFFTLIMTYRKAWHELASSKLWQYACAVVFFIGVLYYGLFFTGLTMTTIGNASIIAQFEVLTSFVLFHVIRKDHISKEHTLGALLMVVGAAIVLAPNFTHFNLGDIFILAATFCAPIGNLFQQKARQIASSESIVFLRCALSFPIILIFAALFGHYASVSDLRSSLPYLLINGIVMFGIVKIMWLESIHRISVTKGMALNSFSILFAMAFAWIFLHQAPTGIQLISLLPMFLGVFLLTDQLKFKKPI